jgi:uncharacterized protein
MSGVSDLDELLARLSPEARAGEYIVATVSDDELGVLAAEAIIREREGATVVLRRADADAAGIPYDYVAAWITLTVHSDLAAVGLTAAVATALADAGISCNVLAGFHHDHLLVPADRRDHALETLAALAER